MSEAYNLDKISSEHISVKAVKSVDSTNDALKIMAENGYDNDLVLISEEQTKGKGRRGRSFFSPKGTGIYLSFLLHPKVCVEDAQILTTVMAVAAACAIQKVTKVDVSIKWVNDLILRDKKISGILTECSPEINDGISKYVVSGIGINIFEPENGFPDEIKNTAGTVYTRDDLQSLSDNERQKIRYEIASELINQFMNFYNQEFNTGNSEKLYLTEYKKRLLVIGKEVEILTPDHTSLNKKAYVLGVNDKCHLHVKYEDGTEEYLSNGEISIKL